MLISLFTDRLAAADDVIPDNTNDRRGWWGDLGEDFLIGSRLWLLARAKLTSDVPLKCKDYITEALAWMLAEPPVRPVADAVTVMAPGPVAWTSANAIPW